MSVADELRTSASVVRGLFAAEACSIAVATDAGDELEFTAADGAGAGAILGVRLPVGRGIAGFVAMSGQPVAIADVARDKRFARDVADATAYVPQVILAAPLLDADGETLGVVEVLDPGGAGPDSGGRSGTGGLEVLSVLATHIGALVRLAGVANSLRAIPDDLVVQLAGLDAERLDLVRQLVSAVAAFGQDEQ